MVKEHRHCIECGSVIDKGKTYCVECGTDSRVCDRCGVRAPVEECNLCPKCLAELAALRPAPVADPPAIKLGSIVSLAGHEGETYFVRNVRNGKALLVGLGRDNGGCEASVEHLAVVSESEVPGLLVKLAAQGEAMAGLRRALDVYLKSPVADAPDEAQGNIGIAQALRAMAAQDCPTVIIPEPGETILRGDDAVRGKAVLDGKVECYRSSVDDVIWYAGNPDGSSTEVAAETPRAAIDAALKAREEASQSAPDTPAPDVTEPEPLPVSVEACREMLKSFPGMWAEERIGSSVRPLVLHSANFPVYPFGIAGEDATLPDWQALIRTAREEANRG